MMSDELMNAVVILVECALVCYVIGFLFGKRK